MALIDLDKFVASFITEIKKNHMVITYNIPSCIKKALEDQGLEYKGGEIVKSQRRVSAEAKENGYGEPDEFGEYINELSKQFPEVSFAKLSRIAVRVKNWIEQQKSK